MRIRSNRNNVKEIKIRTMRKNEEILNEQIGGTLQDEATKLIEMEQVEGTPFTYVRVGEKHFIALGLSKVTEDYDNRQEALDQIYPSNWDFMLSVIFTVVNHAEEMKKQMENQTD